jgi:hypothetical protein
MNKVQLTNSTQTRTTTEVASTPKSSKKVRLEVSIPISTGHF